jgi:hypothetical protein
MKRCSAPEAKIKVINGTNQNLDVSKISTEFNWNWSICHHRHLIGFGVEIRKPIHDQRTAWNPLPRSSLAVQRLQSRDDASPGRERSSGSRRMSRAQCGMQANVLQLGARSDRVRRLCAPDLSTA